MLALQEYLKTRGLRAAREVLNLRVYEHPYLDLVGFKYNQINSPRDSEPTRDARGIVLRADSWELVAKPFRRFFNVGEMEKEDGSFDWSDFQGIEKVDGSLVIVYFYDGKWRANTSGSFGLGDAPNGYPGSWQDMFWEFSQINTSLLDTDRTYVFELCTPWNKVVKRYDTPRVYLLGCNIVRPWDYQELSENKLDIIAKRLGVRRPYRVHFTSAKQAQDYVDILELSESIDEGLVLRDGNGQRLKWKTDRYKLHHHLLDNGNLWRADRLTQVVLRGEQPEVLTTAPEAEKALREVESAISEAINSAWCLFQEANKTESQKEFAMSVKDSPFGWALFQLRKAERQNPAILMELFAAKHKTVAETLFGNKIFQPTINMEK